MPSISSSVREARRELGERLRALRYAAGLTGEELARRMGRHPSKVSRIEHGHAAPSADDIRAWCLHCDAHDQMADLVAWVEAAEGMWVEWHRIERKGLKAGQEAVTPLWERTRWFRAYSSWLIPGAVQTPAYSRAVLEIVRRQRPGIDDIEEALSARANKLRVVSDAGRRFGLVVEESVLRYRIGDAETMTAQLAHLITAAAQPSISLGVIPLDANRSTVWPVEDFWIFDETEVGVELVSGYLSLTQPREIAQYAQVFGALAELAVHGPAARSLITAAIEAVDRST